MPKFRSVTESSATANSTFSYPRKTHYCIVPVPHRIDALPHQFRTRNNLNEPKQTGSKRNKTSAKSTNLIDSLPLITVWLQVRVLPGPPKMPTGCGLRLCNGALAAPDTPTLRSSEAAGSYARGLTNAGYARPFMRMAATALLCDAEAEDRFDERWPRSILPQIGEHRCRYRNFQNRKHRTSRFQEARG
jgi:hypothetical protein